MIANARALGSAQADALQHITGGFEIRNISNSNGSNFDDITAREDGAINASSTASPSRSIAYHAPFTSFQNRSITFDASRVARTSTETRSSNTALAPRLICY